MKKTSLLIASICASSSAFSQVVDFNTANEYTGSFSENDSSVSFPQLSTGGLDNSGFVSITNSDNYAVYQTESYDATAFGAGTTVGGFFLYDGSTISSRPISFGFTSAATDSYQGSSATTGTDIRVSLIGSGSNAGLRLVEGGVQIDASSVDVALTTDTWYYLQLTIGGVSGGSFTGISGQLFATTVVGGETVVGTELKNLNNNGSFYTEASTLTGDSEVYGFFGGIGPASRGITGVDNFTVAVPEPSSYALIAGALALGSIMLKRRK